MRHWVERIARFALVGVVNTAVHYAIYLALVRLIPYLLAYVVAFMVATVCSYFLNCRFTFHVRPTLRGLLEFPLSSLTNFVVSTAGMYVAVQWWSVPTWLAPMPVVLVAVPVTFLVAQFLMARHRAEQPTRVQVSEHSS